MKNIIYAISYVLVFLGLQAAVGLAMQLLWPLLSGNNDVSALMLIVTTAVSSLLAVMLFLKARWAEVSPRWLRTKPWLVLVWSVIAALGTIIPSQWVQELLPALPDIMEDEFGLLLTNRWGYFTIALLVPLAEELVFRGTVLRTLLQSPLSANHSPRASAWTAIAISALIFSVSHINPAQMPHAFVIGLLLGWMYWRTGSILPGIAFHWANNSAAYIIYNIYPDPDIELIDIFRGSQLHVLMAVGFSLLILLPALYQLHLWMRRAE